MGDPSLSIPDESFCTSTSSCFLFSLAVDSDAVVVVVVAATGAAVNFPKSPYRQKSYNLYAVITVATTGLHDLKG